MEYTIKLDRTTWESYRNVLVDSFAGVEKYPEDVVAHVEYIQKSNDIKLHTLEAVYPGIGLCQIPSMLEEVMLMDAKIFNDVDDKVSDLVYEDGILLKRYL